VELTTRGLELVDAAVQANTANERQVLARLGPKEAETLEALLRKVLGGLELPEVD